MLLVCEIHRSHPSEGNDISSMKHRQPHREESCALASSPDKWRPAQQKRLCVHITSQFTELIHIQRPWARSTSPVMSFGVPS